MPEYTEGSQSANGNMSNDVEDSDLEILMLPPLVYNQPEDTEDLEHYVVGGYHPVHINDTFDNDRFKVLHKLGFGATSTVWLARDQQKERLVALKILKAEHSKKSSEAAILTRLASLDCGDLDHHAGRPCICRLLHQFCVEGPNGGHKVLVLEPAGFSIVHSKLASPTRLFPVESARQIATQVLQGLDYMHAMGIVHGDLHPKNIMLKSPRLAAYTA